MIKNHDTTLLQECLFMCSLEASFVHVLIGSVVCSCANWKHLSEDASNEHVTNDS